MVAIASAFPHALQQPPGRGTGTPPSAQQLLESLGAAQGGRGARILIVVDQAEELLPLTPDAAAFVDTLTDLVNGDPAVWLLVVLRSDFLTGFLENGPAAWLQDPVLIGTLDRSKLVSVIEGPAERAGLRFDPGVALQMVEDTGGGDALPLLAYTLQTLYLRTRSRGIVTEDDYVDSGGVAGALARQADRITAEVQRVAPATPAVPTLLRFVSLEGAHPTRRRVKASDLSPSERIVVKAFVDGRVLSGDAERNDAEVHVAHEALFRQWAPLQQEISASADHCASEAS